MSKTANENDELVGAEVHVVTSTVPSELSVHPDGGTKAWLTVFGAFCTFFAGLSLMNSIGVYQTWISENQLRGESQGEIGWIFGLYNFLSFFIGIPLGPVFDVKGPRLLMLVGSVLLIATYLLLGVCKQYWHFFTCLGLVGSLSTCLLFTSAIGTLQHWFLHRRGIATGLAISGGSVGGIAFPLILGKLLPKIGFAWTMRVSALIMVPCLISGNLLLRSRVHKAHDSVKSMLPDPKILATPRMAVLALGAFFVELGLFIPMTYIASYALASGMSSQAAFNIVTFMNVGSLLGRWLPGYLGDKVGRFNAQILALVLCLVSIWGIWKPVGHHTSALIAFVILFGLGSGSGISLVPVCIAQMCRTEDYGKTFTAVYSVASFGSLIGVPLGGLILQSCDGDFWGLIVFAGLAYAAALVCFTGVRAMSVGTGLARKF